MILPLKLRSFLFNVVASLGLIASFWAFFIFLNWIGFPCPRVPEGKFFDLAFFSISTFGTIIFLTIIPLQNTEGNLSPGFLYKITSTPRAHFGIYVLLFTAFFCFLLPALKQQQVFQNCLSELFLALTASMVFAILYLRSWVINCMDQPYVVYNYIEDIKEEEKLESTWQELLECTFKAIKQARIQDANKLINLMALLTKEVKEYNIAFKDDLRGLYKFAQEIPPIRREMEKTWPFLTS